MADTTGSKKPTESKLKGVFGLIFGVLFLFWLFGGGSEKAQADFVQDIEQKVAVDAIAQYNIAKRSGEPVDRCVHAGFVAAAFMQAKDEAKYKEWKATEKEECDAYYGR